MRPKPVLCAVAAALSLFTGCSRKDEPVPQVAVEAQTVEMTTEDGVTLVGTWFEVPGARTAVICLPASNYSRTTWATTAQQIAASGRSVLALDLRDQGESILPPNAPSVWVGSDTMGAITHYMKDVRAAVTFVEQKHPGQRLSYWERVSAGTAACTKRWPIRG